jgi:hypothetical protein
MTDEATSIWRRAGVRLSWDAPRPAANLPGLRVLVVHRAAPRSTEREWPVGELVMARQGTGAGAREVPIAFVSIEAALQILDDAGVATEPPQRTQQRLGVILGRAVAHEVGHYLLNTPTHAASGLMRARIDAEVFADLREGAFFLDRHATRWLAAVSARPPDSQGSGFSYAPH